MKTVALETVGCRLNQYETEKIASQLVGAGMKRVSYKDKADLYILNSCTVTGRADADCRKLINRAHRLSDKAIVVVTGCYVVSQPQQIEDLNAADLTVGNDEKERLPQIIQDKYPHLFPSPDTDDHYTKLRSSTRQPKTTPWWSSTRQPKTAPWRSSARQPKNRLLPAPASGHPGDSQKQAPACRSRAMTKIGDGCDQCCSYCIVPSVRGRLISNPPDEIINEIKRLIDNGYHEVVLTAVHIGKYDYDGLNLAGLVEKILDKTRLSRLRLSSLEPNELDEQQLSFVADHPRVCRHLHLPLQSGSDRILKMMHRPYLRGEYLAIIDRIKKANPDITIGCDLIVGFPGETESDFEQSIDVLNSGHIDYGHIFSYSDRPGTAASMLPDKLNPTVIKQRSRMAHDLCEQNRLKQMQSQIGRILGVISENRLRSGDGYQAVSDNYLKVLLPESSGGGRKIISFRATSLVDDHLEGEIINN